MAHETLIPVFLGQPPGEAGACVALALEMLLEVKIFKVRRALGGYWWFPGSHDVSIMETSSGLEGAIWSSIFGKKNINRLELRMEFPNHRIVLSF